MSAQDKDNIHQREHVVLHDAFITSSVTVVSLKLVYIFGK